MRAGEVDVVVFVVVIVIVVVEVADVIGLTLLGLLLGLDVGEVGGVLFVTLPMGGGELLTANTSLGCSHFDKLSLDELSLDELSLDELSLDELSFDMLYIVKILFDFGSFLSQEFELSFDELSSSEESMQSDIKASTRLRMFSSSS